jgi:hypothetical protein
LCCACNRRAALAALGNFLYAQGVYAQKLSVDVIIGGERKPCPMNWLDEFSMRNFTNSAEFDDTLPIADGRIEASFRVNPQHLADALGAWLTQRGKGAGQPVKVEIRKAE